MSSCQSNLKQLAVAFTQYVQDNDERLPSWYMGFNINGTQATWDIVIQPYLKSAQVITCPSDTLSSVCAPTFYGRNRDAGGAPAA